MGSSWAGLWLLNTGPTLLPKLLSALGPLALPETLYGYISQMPCPLATQPRWASPPGSTAHKAWREGCSLPLPSGGGEASVPAISGGPSAFPARL